MSAVKETIRNKQAEQKNTRLTAFFTNRPIVFLLSTLCCLLWGSAYPAIKGGFDLFLIAANDIPGKMVFAGYRFFLAGAVLLVFAVMTGSSLRRLRVRDFKKLIPLGLVQTTIQYSFFYIGLAHTTGVKGSIMNSTVTFFSVIIAHFLYRSERLKTNRVVGCLLGFAGVMVVNFGTGLLDFNFTILGEGFVVFAAFLFAAASIYGKELSRRMDVMIMSGTQLTIGGIALLILGYAGGGVVDNFTVSSVSVLAFLVIISSAAFALWSILLKYNPVGMITVFNFLVPVSGAMLSALFLGESIMEWKNATALILVCGGIWLVTRK